MKRIAAQDKKEEGFGEGAKISNLARYSHTSPYNLPLDWRMG